eukprot:gb/GECG01016153.1/.p1 GENE.gb/GECG01016153.1/~~gb/GECG01016153.1/.p1  ORF type:complete len:503 (+),score=72.71 gb/GECG01016153.1/:1-1509(+)
MKRMYGKKKRDKKKKTQGDEADTTKDNKPPQHGAGKKKPPHKQAVSSAGARFEGFDRYRNMEPFFMVPEDLIETPASGASEAQGGICPALPPARFSGSSVSSNKRGGKKQRQQQQGQGTESSAIARVMEGGSFLPKSYVTFRGEDPDLQIAFKGLSKKDTNTKLKSVVGLIQHCRNKSLLELRPTLDAYTYWYPHLLVENDRRLRSEATRLLGILIERLLREASDQLPSLLPYWWIAMHDPTTEVSSLAKESFERVFSPRKRDTAIKLTASELCSTLQTLFSENKYSLVSRDNVEEDEAYDCWERCIISGIHSLGHLVKRAAESDEAESYQQSPKRIPETEEDSDSDEEYPMEDQLRYTQTGDNTDGLNNSLLSTFTSEKSPLHLYFDGSSRLQVAVLELLQIVSVHTPFVLEECIKDVVKIAFNVNKLQEGSLKTYLEALLSFLQNVDQEELWATYSIDKLATEFFPGFLKTFFEIRNGRPGIPKIRSFVIHCVTRRCFPR